MNFDREYFGRLTIHDSKIDLGFAPLAIVLQRATNQLMKAKTPNAAALNIAIELSTSKLPDVGILSREQSLLNEMQSLAVDDDEEIYPGITASRVAEVFDTPECAAYRKICEPANRIGLTPEECDAIRGAYASRFPDCFPHFPKWLDS